jgi:hypothetical protein
MAVTPFTLLDDPVPTQIQNITGEYLLDKQ